jgi:hypothetical protein
MNEDQDPQSRRLIIGIVITAAAVVAMGALLAVRSIPETVQKASAAVETPLAATLADESQATASDPVTEPASPEPKTDEAEAAEVKAQVTVTPKPSSSKKAAAPTDTKGASPDPTTTKKATPSPTATKKATPSPTATKKATPSPTATKKAAAKITEVDGKWMDGAIVYPDEDSSARSFQSPSGNISCIMEHKGEQYATCVIKQHSYAVPAVNPDLGPCEVTVFHVAGKGKATSYCAAKQNYPLTQMQKSIWLPYNYKFTLESISCISEKTGMTCQNGSSGFKIAKGSFKIW